MPGENIETLAVDDVFTLDETFEQLVAQAIEKPDDEIAFNGIRQAIATAHEQGDIRFVMETAMYLGAMACMHPHLEEVANEIGTSYQDILGDSGHSRGHEGHIVHNHQDKKSGKKKGKKSSTSLAALLLTRAKKPAPKQVASLFARK